MPRLPLVLALLVGAASSEPSRDTTAPPAVPVPVPGDAAPGCLPVPPPPAVEPARCGNGKIDVSYQLVTPPCIPGRCCASGWAPAPVEECDGADLGQRTCAALGYLGGSLRCTSACTLDAGACDQTAGAKRSGPGVPRFEKVVTSSEPVAGSGTALAVSGKTLAVVAAAGGVLRFRGYDAESLAPLGPARDSAPLFAEDPASPARTFVAPLGDGFVAVVGHGGSSFLFRLSSSRSAPGIQTPERATDTPLNGLALFLAAGGGGALLGLEPGVSGYPVQAVHLDRDGAPDWRPVTVIEAARKAFGNPAAGAFAADGWIVVSGSRAPDPAEDVRGKLFAAWITPQGAVRASSALAASAPSVAIATDGVRAFAVHAGRNGIEALELTRDGKGTRVQLADASVDRFDRVLAAELRDGVLTALVGVGARGGNLASSQPSVAAVYRVRATLPLPDSAPSATTASPELVLSGPGLVPAAGLLSDGKLYLVYADASGKQTLYSAR